MNQINPLLDQAIYQLLEQAPCSEFDLIKALQNPPFEILDKNALAQELTMFQAHFVVHNALYRLRNKGLDNALFILDILPTKIEMLPYQRTQPAIKEHDKLAQYYLNWDNFCDTTAEDVTLLINSFWKKMAGQLYTESELSEALAILGLDSLPAKNELKKHYRQLMLKHHPDRGGESERAGQLTMAYEVLIAVV